MLKEFRDFLFRGNIIELAVAFVMGLAFAAVVNSLVNNLLMPVIAMIIGKAGFPGPDVHRQRFGFSLRLVHHGRHPVRGDRSGGVLLRRKAGQRVADPDARPC
jgi:large conductance mechanosensitive channel protein